MSDLLQRCCGISEPLSGLSEYLTFVRDVSEEWQMTDWTDLERNEDYPLNDARICRTCLVSRPRKLQKQPYAWHVP